MSNYYYPYPPQSVTPNNTGYSWAASSQQPTQPPQPQQTSNGFNWVQGEEGAKAYLVAPGNRVLLMDSENPVIYIKSADVNGRPLPMEVYDLVKREPVPVQQASPVDTSAFITRDELDSIIEEKTREIMKRNRNNKKGDTK